MQIHSAKTREIMKRVKVKITTRGRTYYLFVSTLNGRVLGKYDNVSTTDGGYFDLSETTRKKHFEEIEKYVNRYIK